MKILITEDRKLHLQAIGNTAQQEAATRQELAVSVEFADTSLIDADTENVLIKIKTSRAAENLAASATIVRVGETAVFSGFINLSTSILNELADGSIVLMECTWILATKVQRSDPRQLMIRQSIVTGDEGAPEADQSITDRLTWLSDYIIAGDNITITEDSDLGTITISSEAGGDVAWADITGKPSTFTPATHSHTISDTTGLQAAIDGKAATSHSHIIADTTGLQAAIDGKAATSHAHAISDVTNLQSSLDGKSATGHTHVKADVGLGNVDNTSDANKPVSTAVQSALNLKLDLAGGTMTGQLVLNNASATGSLNLAPTWVGSTVFTGIYMRASDSGSGASLLADLGVGSSQVFSFGKAGDFRAVAGSNYMTFSSAGSVGYYDNALGFRWRVAGVDPLYSNGAAVQVGAAGAFSWQSTNRVDAGTSDTILRRVAAGVMEVANGVGVGGMMGFLERTTPTAPSANRVVIYADDNGSGKTRLMALFASGAAQQIVIEP